MTDRFVRGTTGNNANSGADWNNAKQTVAGAIAIAAAGDNIYVDNGESFTANAAITWTPPAGALQIISCVRSGTTGVAWNTSTGAGAGAAEGVGNSNSPFTVAAASGSSLYIFGMVINGSTNAGAAANIFFSATVASVASLLYLQTCTVDLKTAANTTGIQFGPTASATSRSCSVVAKNCTLICSGSRTGQFLFASENLTEIINPTISITGVTKPTVFLTPTAINDACEVIIRDADLTGWAVASSAYFNVAALGGRILVKNCKTSATPTLTTGTWPAGGTGSITLRNVDSADTINTFQYVNLYGTLTVSASVYLTAGLKFNSTGVSWQIVTTSSANEAYPFVTPPLSIWGTTTSAQTAELEFVRDNATALTDREIWSDMEYPASASFPNYTYAINRNTAPFSSAGSAQPSSSVAWTGTGGFSNLNRQKLQIAFTAAEVGLLQSRVFVGKASETLYLNPSISNVT